MSYTELPTTTQHTKASSQFSAIITELTTASSALSTIADFSTGTSELPSSTEYTTTSTGLSANTNQHITASIELHGSTTEYTSASTGLSITTTEETGLSTLISVEHFPSLVKHTTPEDTTSPTCPTFPSIASTGLYTAIAEHSKSSTDLSDTTAKHTSAFPELSNTTEYNTSTEQSIITAEASITTTEHTTAASELFSTTADHTLASNELSITGHSRPSSDMSMTTIEYTTQSPGFFTASTKVNNAYTELSSTTQYSTASIQHFMTPTENSTMSTQHTTSTVRSIASTEHAKASAEHVMISVKQASASTEHIKTSTQHSTAPAEHKTASTEPSTTTTERTTTSVTHTSAFAQHTTVSTEHNTVSNLTDGNTEYTTASIVLSTISEHTTAYNGLSNGEHTTAFTGLSASTKHTTAPTGRSTYTTTKNSTSSEQITPPDHSTAPTALFTGTEQTAGAAELSVSIPDYRTRFPELRELSTSSTERIHRITKLFPTIKVPVGTAKLLLTTTQLPLTTTFTSPITPKLEPNATSKELPTLLNMPSNPPVTSPVQCNNGGELLENACVCPEEYNGLTCETANFCNETMKNGFTFNKTTVGWFSYSRELCTTTGGNAGWPKATARCTKINGLAQFQEPQTMTCGTTLSDLREKMSSTNLTSIAISTQILTSKAEILTAKNITMAAQIATELLLSSTSEEVIIAAITTISQLLNANSSIFSSQSSNATKSLTLALEKFSLTQNISLNGSAIVQPNLAVRSVSLLSGFTRGIQFSIVGSTSQALALDRIYVNTNATQLTINASRPTSLNIFIKFPPGGPRRATNVGFVLYQNDKFFHPSAFMTPLGTSRNVISASISSRRRGSRKVVPEFVELLYRPAPIHDGVFEDFACVFWDYNLSDWSTRGCAKSSRSNESSLDGPTVGCICNHTTSFAVLTSFRKNVTYSEALNWITILGCSVLIVVLCGTILLELIFSNCWMSNSTLMLVCSYLSLLLFNLLFLIGANNRPHPRGTNHDAQNHLLLSDRHTDRDVGSCTTVAALTHFFLLASFTWNALLTTETLLMRLKKGSSQKTRPSSSHTNLGSSAIGWGIPLLLVSMTLAFWYRVDNPLNYRQEEFCWLAALDEAGRFDPRKPMLWSFLIPVALMLILNITELVYFMATLAKRAQRHNNRKTDGNWNAVKEFLSSLSLAVLLVLSSLLGYLMLLNHDPDVHSVLSIIFCVFNVIQALQILLLIPDWGQVFSMMPSLPSPAVSLGLHSKKYHVRPQQSDGPQEMYRKMETGFVSSLQPLPLSLGCPSEPEEKEP